MTADPSTASPFSLPQGFRLQALLSAILVAAGGLVVAMIVAAGAIIALPLLLAASITARRPRTRRGWTELAPIGV